MIGKTFIHQLEMIDKSDRIFFCNNLSNFRYRLLDVKYPPVLSKRDFVRRYKAGEFGNASPTWDTLEEFQAAKCPAEQPIHIRNRVAGGPTWYDIPAEWVPSMFKMVTKEVPADSLYLSAMAPTDKTVIQGEIRRSINHYDLTYSHLKLPMREALRRDAYHFFGLQSLLLLKHHLPPRDIDWLQYLLDTYEDHVVEFSTYSVQWGTVPGYQTVFWEVRKY